METLKSNMEFQYENMSNDDKPFSSCAKFLPDELQAQNLRTYEVVPPWRR
jgi:hypothetical protein